MNLVFSTIQQTKRPSRMITYKEIITNQIDNNIEQTTNINEVPLPSYSTLRKLMAPQPTKERNPFQGNPTQYNMINRLSTANSSCSSCGGK